MTYTPENTWLQKSESPLIDNRAAKPRCPPGYRRARTITRPEPRKTGERNPTILWNMS
jgi:hypothetical protein